MARRPVLIKICVATGLSLLVGQTAFEGGVRADGTFEDFESDTEGQAPTNWTSIQDRIVLGDTFLADCQSQDQATYSTLDNLDDPSRFLWPPEETGGAPTFGSLGPSSHSFGYFAEWIAPDDSGQYVAAGQRAWWDTYQGGYGFGSADEYPDDFSQLPTAARVELLQRQARHLNDQKEDPSWFRYDDRYDVMVLEGPGYGIGKASQVLQLYSSTDSYPGHVIHGPAVVSSDVFEITGTTSVSFKFAASRDMDYFHVYGYLQDVNDCSNQIPIIDETGEYLGWTTVSGTVETTGTYRFVFVGGTYDGTWGELGGALLWIDDIGCVGACEVITCGDTTDDPSNPNAECKDIVVGPDPITSVDEIEFVGRENGGLSFDFALPAVTDEQLPATGSEVDLLALAAALVVLGGGLIVLRRRVAQVS